jgi:hypothetical protein
MPGKQSLYGEWDMAWITDESRFDSKQEQEIIILKTAAPTRIKCIITRGLSLGVRRPVRKADHSPPNNVKFQKEDSYVSIPPYAFMTCTRKILAIYYEQVRPG